MRRKVENLMGLKAFGVLTLAVAAAMAASQWPDISRYIKIKQMSFGQGHPENVPTRGRASYPSPAGG
jgi:hypothetical protein